MRHYNHRRGNRKVAKKASSFDRVRKLGLALPNVEQGTTYGSPALKVGGKMFACVALHRSAEPDTLAVRLPFEQRDGLLAAEPDTYYLTGHYVDYPCVLVRLKRINQDALKDLLLMAWRFVSSRDKRRRARRFGPAKAGLYVRDKTARNIRT